MDSAVEILKLFRLYYSALNNQPSKNKMLRQYCFIYIVLFYLNYNLTSCHCEKSTLISIKQPVVTYYNKEYIKSFRMTSRRYSRADHQYYTSTYFESLATIDNTVQIEIFLYEFREYTYRRTFIELRLKMCEYLELPYFGATLKKALHHQKCPLPPGKYEVENVTLSSLPFIMPFRQGRLYNNVTRVKGGTETMLVSSYMDIILQDLKVNPK